MKKFKLVFTSLLVAIIFYGCGASVKVADEWRNDNFAQLKGEKILVIHKTPDEVSRKRFEQDVSKALRAEGIDAVEAYLAFPEEGYKENRTGAETEAIVEKVKAAGYNGVVLTVLKDKDQQLETTSSGGYYSGGMYPTYYGRYYRGFGSYYGGVHSYGYGGGSYTPSTSTTKVVEVYTLETVSYNLSMKPEEQLVGVVSVKVTDPDSYSKVAKKYVKIIVDQYTK